ncbi:hypothetical protein QTP81_13695 [Alteromonas sp. ASW11-36]|uniref:DUF2975 domain-containing protein n=1 Tax=Alteromonas arenosi TaxID=3055817 RepID=A0ABT7T069_9ALTE|nr:hypothetical protein [Alteromonas sp. ASW11-36]MDM7861649.1 hypothetical protein [Alteromonas sp. ASW11-36]
MKGSLNLVEAALAIMGAWFIFSPLPEFFAGVFTYLLTDYTSPNDPIWIGSVLFTALKVALGISLIAFRSRIASLIGQYQDNSLQVQNVLSAALLVLGLYFVLDGTVSLGQYIALEGHKNISNTYLFWQGIFSISIGGLLSISSILISRIWWRFQRGET